MWSWGRRAGCRPHKYDKGGEPQHSTVANTQDNPDLADWREKHKRFGCYNNIMIKISARETLCCLVTSAKVHVRTVVSGWLHDELCACWTLLNEIDVNWAFPLTAWLIALAVALSGGMFPRMDLQVIHRPSTHTLTALLQPQNETYQRLNLSKGQIFKMCHYLVRQKLPACDAGGPTTPLYLNESRTNRGGKRWTFLLPDKSQKYRLHLPQCNP